MRKTTDLDFRRPHPHTAAEWVTSRDERLFVLMVSVASCLESPALTWECVGVEDLSLDGSWVAKGGQPLRTQLLSVGLHLLICFTAPESAMSWQPCLEYRAL